MKKESYIQIGKLTKTIGLKGHLKLSALAGTIYDVKVPCAIILIKKKAELNILSPQDPILIQKDFIAAELETIQPLSGVNNFRILLKNITSINEAERFIGHCIYLNLNYLPKPLDDEVYAYELIGFQIKSENSQRIIGTILNIHSYGAHPNLEIELDDAVRQSLNLENKNLEIPFVSHYIKKIDKNKKIIEIADIESFLELL